MPPACPLRAYRAASRALSVSETDAQVLDIIEWVNSRASDGVTSVRHLVGDEVRLPNTEHEAHTWVIAQVAPDFKLLDAWGLSAEGGLDEFAALIEIMTFSIRPTGTREPLARSFRCTFAWDAGLGGTTRPASSRSPAAPKRR